MESNFVDYVKIMCRSGKGGKGSMHLKHVKYNPNGGPDGGDGGKGGSIILRGNHNYWTLLHLKYERHIFAEHGGNGGKDKCHGTDGKDVYIDVPCGTVVYNAETGKYVCDDSPMPESLRWYLPSAMPVRRLPTIPSPPWNHHWALWVIAMVNPSSWPIFLASSKAPQKEKASA